MARVLCVVRSHLVLRMEEIDPALFTQGGTARGAYQPLLDLVDLEGQLKNMPVSTDEYATEYLTGRETYVVIRVDSELFLY